MVLHKCLTIVTFIHSNPIQSAFFSQDFDKNPENQTIFEGIPPVEGIPLLTRLRLPSLLRMYFYKFGIIKLKVKDQTVQYWPSLLILLVIPMMEFLKGNTAYLNSKDEFVAYERWLKGFFLECVVWISWNHGMKWRLLADGILHSRMY